MKMYLLQTIRPDSDLGIASNWSQIRKNDNDVTNSNIAPSSGFYDIAVFFLVTGPSFTSISLLVLELSQFSSIKGWPEIWKLEIHPSEFCPISGDWGKLGIPNLSPMSLMKCYWMLQNARFTAFTVSELLREN